MIAGRLKSLFSSLELMANTGEQCDTDANRYGLPEEDAQAKTDLLMPPANETTHRAGRVTVIDGGEKANIVTTGPKAIFQDGVVSERAGASFCLYERLKGRRFLRRNRRGRTLA